MINCCQNGEGKVINLENKETLGYWLKVIAVYKLNTLFEWVEQMGKLLKILATYCFSMEYMK